MDLISQPIQGAVYEADGEEEEEEWEFQNIIALSDRPATSPTSTSSPRYPEQRHLW